MRKFVRWLPILALAAGFGLPNTGCTAKVKESYHSRRAERYFAAGDYGPAEIEYKNVLRDNPQNARAWSQLGIIYFEQGRYLPAVPILLRAQQLATNNVEARLKLGSIYLFAGRTKEARNEAITALNLDPRNRQAPVLLAESTVMKNDVADSRQRLQALAARGDPAAVAVALGILALRDNDFKTAEADFKQAQALDPKFDEADWALGNLYLAEKELKQADQQYQAAAALAPIRSGRKLQYAQFKIAMGDPATGKRLMEELTKAAPDYLPAWTALARLAIDEKKYDDAAQLLAKIFAADPNDFDAMLLDAQVKLAKGDTAAATAELERMVKRYPPSPQLDYQLAVAYLAGNNYSQAIGSLNQALKLDPQFAAGILLLAQIEMHNGDTASASFVLKQLIQQQPQLIQAKALLAQADGQAGNWDGAILIYHDLAGAHPEDPQIHYLLGAAWLQEKQDDKARAEFERARVLAPDYLPPMEQLVNLDLAQKQYAAAWQRVEQLSQTNLQTGAAQLLLAKIAAARGDTNQEETCLSKAIEYQPASPTAYLLLAQLHVDAHQNGQALAELQAALAKNPKNESVLMFLGMVYNDEKNYADAARMYQELLGIDPKTTVALNNLACLDAEHLDRLDDAYQLARQARDLQPADPVIADTLGWILCKKKQYASALALLQDSAGKLANEPEAQFHLGMTYYLTGDEANARAAFQRARQTGKNFPGQAECDQCLAVLAVDAKTAGADAAASLEKRVADHPDDLIALLRLAAIEQRNGDVKKATAAYEAALKADPQNSGVMTTLARLYAASDPQKAFELAQNAYKLAPEDPQVSLVLGRLAYQTGDSKWAYSLLAPAVQNTAVTPDTLYDFGMAAYYLGKVSEATAAMQNILKTASASSQAAKAEQFLDLTTVAGNPTGALAESSKIDQVLQSDPNDVPALMAKALINEQKSDTGGASQLYEKVLSQHPDFAPAQARLAILDSADATKDARTYGLAVKAHQAFPDDPAVDKALGSVIYRRASSPDDYRRAAGLLAESARRRPQDAELLYYLGMAQYHLKQPAESKATLQEALALNLPGQLASEAKRVLTELK